MCKSPEKDSKSTLLEIIEIIFVTYWAQGQEWTSLLNWVIDSHLCYPLYTIRDDSVIIIQSI